MTALNLLSQEEKKYRFFSYVSILLPSGGFLLIPLLEASSNRPSYNGIVPGWQNTIISIYALFIVIMWIVTSIYYSKSETKKAQIIKEQHIIK